MPQVNADLSLPAIVRFADVQWIPSPGGEVDRFMLDRDGDEVARATSLVRYRPNSTFPPHTHGGGEEFYVLEGTFADEHGDYPSGFYIRNPVGSSHSPRVGRDGCLIFVRLRWMRPYEPSVMYDTNRVPFSDDVGRWQVLYTDSNSPETVVLGNLPPGAKLSTDGVQGVEARMREEAKLGGVEIVVVSGHLAASFSGADARALERVQFAQYDWLRRPPGTSGLELENVGASPAKALVRTGYLAGWLGVHGKTVEHA